MDPRVIGDLTKPSIMRVDLLEDISSRIDRPIKNGRAVIGFGRQVGMEVTVDEGGEIAPADHLDA